MQAPRHRPGGTAGCPDLRGIQGRRVADKLKLPVLLQPPLDIPECREERARLWLQPWLAPPAPSQHRLGTRGCSLWPRHNRASLKGVRAARNPQAGEELPQHQLRAAQCNKTAQPCCLVLTPISNSRCRYDYSSKSLA